MTRPPNRTQFESLFEECLDGTDMDAPTKAVYMKVGLEAFDQNPMALWHAGISTVFEMVDRRVRSSGLDKKAQAIAAAVPVEMTEEDKREQLRKAMSIQLVAYATGDQGLAWISQDRLWFINRTKQVLFDGPPELWEKTSIADLIKKIEMQMHDRHEHSAECPDCGWTGMMALCHSEPVRESPETEPYTVYTCPDCHNDDVHWRHGHDPEMRRREAERIARQERMTLEQETTRQELGWGNW